jgi:hypothetical protein
MGSRAATDGWGDGAAAARADRRRLRILFPALLFSLLLPVHATAAPPREGKEPPPATSFEDRREVEREARTRFRRLEVSSLVLIAVCAGGAAWWILRKK